jgi:hypothetical protein
MSSEEHNLANTCLTRASNVVRLDCVRPGDVWKGNQIELRIMRRIWEFFYQSELSRLSEIHSQMGAIPRTREGYEEISGDLAA